MTTITIERRAPRDYVLLVDGQEHSHHTFAYQAEAISQGLAGAALAVTVESTLGFGDDEPFTTYRCGDVAVSEDTTLLIDGRCVFGHVGDDAQGRRELRQLRTLLNDARVVALLEA